MNGKINKSTIQLKVPKEEIMKERKYSETMVDNFQKVANQTQFSELNMKQSLIVKLGLS